MKLLDRLLGRKAAQLTYDQVASLIDGVGGVIYNGVGGQTSVQASEPMPMTIDGQATWIGSLSLFGVLDAAANDLQAPNSGAQAAQTVADGLRDVDQVMGRLQWQRARAGEMLNRADAVEQRLGDVTLHAQTQRSLAEDVDMVQALSDFKMQQTGYEAALSTYGDFMGKPLSWVRF